MLKCWLGIAFTQLKVGNTYEHLLNEIRKIPHFLYKLKEVIKKVYSNVMASIKLQNRMDTILMNSENSKKSNPYRLLINLSDKINLKRSDKHATYQTLAFPIYGKI